MEDNCENEESSLAVVNDRWKFLSNQIKYYYMKIYSLDNIKITKYTNPDEGNYSGGGPGFRNFP